MKNNRKICEKIRLLGLIQGDVNDPLSRAGINYRLYRALRNTCAVVDVLDVEPAGLERYWLGLHSFHPNGNKWRKRFHESPKMFESRTRLAGRKIARVDKHFDVILQDGAMWLPGRNIFDKPLITYHEMNVMLGSEGGPLAQGSHYQGRKLARAISLEREVYDRASCVLAFSEWARKSMISDFQVDEKKVRLMRPGVNFEIPENLSKNYENPIILFVGRDFERKGGPILLQAFRKVKKRVKHARLIIVGCNPDIAGDGIEIKGLIPRERESEIRRIYEEASVFVMASHFEPFGLVFLEAMAYKLPCIGADICAMPEIIGDSECGFVVEPGNPDQLADRLITLLTDAKLMRQMGERGHHKVRTQYTWEKAATEIAEYCRELI